VTSLAAGLQAIFENNQDDFQRRISTLEQAVAAIRDGTLDERLRAGAERDAHKLVGSLGTFGMPRGSQLARMLELRFASSHEPVAAEDAHLEKVFDVLRGELDDKLAGGQPAVSGTGVADGEPTA
jgi:HPt (histidine-containing phosphotransfer) domain-containing protein